MRLIVVELLCIGCFLSSVDIAGTDPSRLLLDTECSSSIYIYLHRESWLISILIYRFVKNQWCQIGCCEA